MGDLCLQERRSWQIAGSPTSGRSVGCPASAAWCTQEQVRLTELVRRVVPEPGAEPRDDEAGSCSPLAWMLRATRTALRRRMTTRWDEWFSDSNLAMDKRILSAPPVGVYCFGLLHEFIGTKTSGVLGGRIIQCGVGSSRSEKTSRPTSAGGGQVT